MIGVVQVGFCHQQALLDIVVEMESLIGDVALDLTNPATAMAHASLQFHALVFERIESPSHSVDCSLVLSRWCPELSNELRVGAVRV